MRSLNYYWDSSPESRRARHLASLRFQSPLKQNQRGTRRAPRSLLTSRQGRCVRVPQSEKDAENDYEMIMLSSDGKSDDDKPSDKIPATEGDKEPETIGIGEETGGSRICSRSASPSTSTGTTDTDGWDGDDEDDEKRDGMDDMFRKNLICRRCSSETVGPVFTNRFHIKRHSFGDIFSCPTCRRPFLSLPHCAAHEMIAHGTPVADNLFDKVDLVISAAKVILAEKNRRQNANGERPQPGTSGTATSGTGNASGHDVKDDLDTGRIVTSSSFRPYQGPPVDHLVQCYEIHLNHGHPGSQHADEVAEFAIHQHILNAMEGRDINRLGQFSKKLGLREQQHQNQLEKESVDHFSQQLETEEELFIPVTKESSNQKKKIGLRQRHAQSSGSSSPSSPSEQAPAPGPSQKKKPRPEVETEKAHAAPKRKRKLPTHPGSWTTVGDRPGPPPQACRRHSSRFAFSKIHRRPQERPYRPPAPLPDSTFTEKERFLDGLGLSNSIRWHLHLKKPLSQLKFRDLSLNVKNMGGLGVPSESDTDSS